MGGIRTSVKKLDVMNRQEFYKEVAQTDDIEVRTLMVLGYLTAGRISELLLLRKKDIRKEVIGDRSFLVFRMRLLKKWDVIGKRKLPDGRTKYKTKRRLEVRNAPVPIDTERQFLDLVWDYVMSRPLEAKILPKSRQWAWLRLNEKGIFPHYLRHLRITHLVQRGFTDQELVQFVGWENSMPAKTYTHLRWQDVVRKM